MSLSYTLKSLQVSRITLGPLTFSGQELWISFVSSLIVIPVNVAIDQLFRRCRPKPGKVSTTNKKDFDSQSDVSSVSSEGKPKTGCFTCCKSKPKDKDEADHSDAGGATMYGDTSDIFTVSRPESAASNVDLTSGDIKEKLPTDTADSTEQKGQNGEATNNADNGDSPSSYPMDSDDLSTRPESSSAASTGPLCKSHQEETTKDKRKKRDSVSSRFSFMSSRSQAEDLEERVAQNVERLEKKGKKGKKTLPYWCVYVAWFLVVLTVAVPAFFVFTYSMEWGEEKSNAWLTAMLLSVVESVTLIQPTKVRIIHFWRSPVHVGVPME